jgi:hypothetical protein
MLSGNTEKPIRQQRAQILLFQPPPLARTRHPSAIWGCQIFNASPKRSARSAGGAADLTAVVVLPATNEHGFGGLLVLSQ